MSRTVVFEPGHLGHRYVYVQYLAQQRQILLLTSRGGEHSDEADTYLRESDVRFEALQGPRRSSRPLASLWFAHKATKSALRHGSDHMIWLDGDRFALALLPWLLLRPKLRRMDLDILLMRPPTVDSKLRKDRIKRQAGKCLLAVSPRIAIHCLVGDSRQLATLPTGFKPIWDPASAGVSLSKSERAQKREEFRWGSRLVLIVPGALSRRKGVLAAVEFAASLSEPVHLVLAGKLDADVRADLLQALDAKPVSVDLIDRLLTDEDLDDLISAADAALLFYANTSGPSGIGKRCLDLGTPVIATGNLHLRSLITEHGAGYYSHIAVPEISDLRACCRDWRDLAILHRSEGGTPKQFAHQLLRLPTDGSTEGS